jgi:hypothetical protein
MIFGKECAVVPNPSIRTNINWFCLFCERIGAKRLVAIGQRKTASTSYREKRPGHNISTPHRTLQTPPAPEENGAQRADAWTHSADLHVCPNMSSRQHFWPEPTTRKTKLWGIAEDPRKTTNFVEYHGLRVWMVMAERWRRNKNNKLYVIFPVYICTCVHWRPRSIRTRLRGYVGLEAVHHRYMYGKLLFINYILTGCDLA